MRRSDRFLVIGEAGTTKTATAAKALYWASQHVHGGTPPAHQRAEKIDFTPAIVLCPENVVEQWQEELATTIPGAQTVIIAAYRTAAEMAIFRRFDPTCTQTQLTVMGCIDRVGTKIQATLATWRVAYQEAQRAKAPLPPKPCFVAIMGFSAAKLGSAWTPRYQLRILRERVPVAQPDDTWLEKVKAVRDATGALVLVPCCPRCMTPITPSAQEKIDAPYLRADQIGCDAKRVCHACHEALWQLVPDVSTSSLAWHATPPPLSRAGREEPVVPLLLPEDDAATVRATRAAQVVTAQDYRRYPGAEYLRWRWRGLFTTIIADEAHLLAAQGSAQGMATDALVAACRPQPTLIGMTGTLKDYASSMFQLLWRFNRQVRTRYPYGSAGLRRWLSDMGMQQKVEIRPPQREDGAMSNRREARRVMREIPGFSPAIILYEENCIFPKMAHIAPALPPLSEEVIRIPLGEVLGLAYRAFEAEATSALYRELAQHQNGGLASWFQGISIWPSMPWLAQAVQNRRAGTRLATATPLDATLIFPKEQVLLELVREHLAQGRRICILVENSSDVYDLPSRYVQLLRADDARWQAGEPVTPTSTEPGPARPAEHVLNVVALRSGMVATRKRQTWIRDQIAKGCNVLITQSGLVHVGMNLDFPTMLATQICYDTCRGRQSVRRSYRPWQKKAVCIRYLVYQRTAEERGLYLIAEKTRAAMMAEGDLPDAGLAAFGAEFSNIKLALARAVYDSLHTDQHLVDGSLEHLWADLERTQERQHQFVGANVLNAAMTLSAPVTEDGAPAPVAPTVPAVVLPAVRVTIDGAVTTPSERPPAIPARPDVIHEVVSGQRSWDDPRWLTQLTERKAVPRAPRATRHRPGDGHTCVYAPSPLVSGFVVCTLCGDRTASGLAPLVISRSTYVALSCADALTWQVELVGAERQAREIVASQAERQILDDPEPERRRQRLATLTVLTTSAAQKQYPRAIYAYRRQPAMATSTAPTAEAS